MLGPPSIWMIVKAGRDSAPVSRATLERRTRAHMSGESGAGEGGAQQGASPVVSKRAEAGLVEKMKVEARRQCKPVIAAYAECTQKRTISVIWACRPQLRAMNECLGQ